MSDHPARSLVPPDGWLGPVAAERAPVSPGFVWAATALALLVRLAGLTSQSLWVDEIMTWRAVRPDAGLSFLAQIRDAIQGPLYLAVVWPLVRLGPPELMLRLPAALAGAAVVPVVAAVAARLLDRPAARLAVLLVAINPFLVWYSQEARGYAFLVLFGALMVLAFLRLREAGPNVGDGVLFALASAATVWSNLSGLFLWAALGLAVLLERPRAGRAWLGWGWAFLGGFAAALPWLLQAAGIWAVDRIVPGAGTGEALRGDTTFTPSALPYTFFTFFFGFTLGPSLQELHEPGRMAAVRQAAGWLAAGLVPAALGFAWGLGHLGRRERQRWSLAVLVAVPAVILLLLAVRNVKPWNPRYLAAVVPWVLMITSWGLLRLPRRAGPVLAFLLVAVTMASLVNLRFSSRYAREDIRGAAAWASAQADAHRPALVPVITGVWRFYDPAGGPVIDAFGTPPLRSPADADAYLASRLEGVDRLWYVAARTWDFDPHGLLVP
ncbi:MAG TPA: glycosyltransferase family 39 protein, partial [Candidatus Krumholzibacteria bacterium]|nr:glycosyltransferase family 39 protein [Candidatus Krumholzibacteria bacterium]